MDSKNNKPFLILITVSVISLLILIGTLIAYQRDSLLNFNGHLNKDYFPAFGTFVSSVIGILFSGATTILVYFTYLSQQKLINEQTKVFNRDYIKYIDSIRPLIELRFVGTPTSFDGAFIFEVKENSACSFQLINESPIHVDLDPFVINREYFNKNTPLRFTYKRNAQTQLPTGLKGELKLKVSYEDFLHNRYEQTFSSIFDHAIFISSEPIIVKGWREAIKLN